MRLEEVMKRDVLTIERTASLEEARSMMRLHEVRHLVVVDDNHVTGVLSERRIGLSRGLVQDVMTADVVSATPRTTVREAANLMRGHRIGCLPVMIGARLVGIITDTDLLDLIGSGKVAPSMEKQRATLKMRKPILRQSLPRAGGGPRKRSA